MIRKLFRAFLRRALPRHFREIFIEDVFQSFGMDPLLYSYNRIGILNYRDLQESGEVFFLQKICLPHLQKFACPILFDVGANTGEYSLELAFLFPKSKIFAFEPLESAFLKAQSQLSGFNNVEVLPLALGSEKGLKEIFVYRNDPISQHASLFKNVLEDIHKNNQIISQSIELDTLGSFCSSRGIEKIHFLKIDTEGFEMEVLKGASSLITNNLIEIIQFEFNEMNVVSRVFFKDFFDLFKKSNYRLYRLNSRELIPIKEYDAIHEIYKFQNLIALSSSVHHV
jgi:FkbM family methyltransferase